MACGCGGSKNQNLSYILNMRNKVLRTPSEMADYLSNNLSKYVAQRPDIVNKFVSSCTVQKIDDIELVTSFYYHDLFETLPAAEFEQFLHAIGSNFLEFLNNRDRWCEYSDSLGCHYCPVRRGYSCRLTCGFDCPG